MKMIPCLPCTSYSENSLKRGYIGHYTGDYTGEYYRGITGDTRSSDYGSYRLHPQDLILIN